MNTMQRISIHYVQLSNSERKVCDLILENPEVIINNPIAEAAKIYNVSPSSILRMSKKVGYKGYSEFRYALEASVIQNKENKDSSRISRIMESYQNVLQDLKTAFDEQEIIKFVEDLKTKKFYTIGIGNSSLPAKQLVYVLYPLGKWGECVDDSVRINYLSEDLNKDDFVIFFSVSGSIENYEKICQKCKNVGATTALITMNQESYIASLTDYCFVLPSLPISFMDKDKQPRYLDNRSLFFIFIEVVLSYYLG